VNGREYLSTYGPSPTEQVLWTKRCSFRLASRLLGAGTSRNLSGACWRLWSPTGVTWGHSRPAHDTVWICLYSTIYLPAFGSKASRVCVDHGKGQVGYSEPGRSGPNLDFTRVCGVNQVPATVPIPRVVAAAQEQTGKVIHAQVTTTVSHQTHAANSKRSVGRAENGPKRDRFGGVFSKLRLRSRRDRHAVARMPQAGPKSSSFNGRLSWPHTGRGVFDTLRYQRCATGFHPLMAALGWLQPFPHAGVYG